MKKNNKGFTLVELIVVLVILAILAAILVPALLGYIDRAREKQYVLDAKSALTAAQAELSSIYGEGGNLDSLTVFLFAWASLKKLMNASDMSYLDKASCSSKVEILVYADFMARIKSLDVLLVIVDIFAP